MYVRRSARPALFLAASAVIAYAPAAAAQTIRPLVSEYQREARGRVEVVNDSDRPLNVVMEPRGFSVTENGDMRDQPLPDQVHLKLSAMSFRLPPRQSRFVFYEAVSDRAPSWFVLYANLTGYPIREFSGINVQLELPHIVYILPKERWVPSDIRIADVSVEREAGKLVLVLENNGQNFGRIAALEVQGVHRKVSAAGFPLFPGARRRVELTWDADETPESVSIRAREFSFQRGLPRSIR